LADAAKEFGGRLAFETRLPGLATWGRVATGDCCQLRRAAEVNLYRARSLPDDILGLEHIIRLSLRSALAKMLFRTLEVPSAELDGPVRLARLTTSQWARSAGPVVVFDFDNYYMAGAIAEQLLGKSLSDVFPPAGTRRLGPSCNDCRWLHRALVQGRPVPIHTSTRDGFDARR